MSYVTYDNARVFVSPADSNQVPTGVKDVIYATNFTASNSASLTRLRRIGEHLDYYIQTGPKSSSISIDIIPVSGSGINQITGFLALTGDSVSGSYIRVPDYRFDKCFLKNFSINIEPWSVLSVNMQFDSYGIATGQGIKTFNPLQTGETLLSPLRNVYISLPKNEQLVYYSDCTSVENEYGYITGISGNVSYSSQGVTLQNSLTESGAAKVEIYPAISKDQFYKPDDSSIFKATFFVKDLISGGFIRSYFPSSSEDYVDIYTTGNHEILSLDYGIDAENAISFSQNFTGSGTISDLSIYEMTSEYESANFSINIERLPNYEIGQAYPAKTSVSKIQKILQINGISNTKWLSDFAPSVYSNFEIQMSDGNTISINGVVKEQVVSVDSNGIAKGALTIIEETV